MISIKPGSQVRGNGLLGPSVGCVRDATARGTKTQITSDIK